VALIAERRRESSGNGTKPKRGVRGSGYAFVKSLPAPAESRNGNHVVGGPLASQGRLAVSDWGRVVAEAYGLLQTNLAFARTGSPIRVVVVTSPLAEDGKTTCATNLAISLVLRGSRALLIDADLRRGVVHTALDAPRTPGLADVLTGAKSIPEAIRSVRIGSENGELHFMTTGTLPANPSGLLETAFAAFLAKVRDQFDTVIIDSPPVNIISDACVLGLQADGVLVVARSGVTQSSALAFATEQLARVGVPLLGVVLNDIDFKREAGYDTSYRQYTGNPYFSTTQGS